MVIASGVLKRGRKGRFKPRAALRGGGKKGGKEKKKKGEREKKKKEKKEEENMGDACNYSKTKMEHLRCGATYAP